MPSKTNEILWANSPNRLRFGMTDRGGHQWIREFPHFQLDWLGSSDRGRFEDNGIPILIQESIAVNGTVPHERAVRCKSCIAYTYVKDLQGYKNFKIIPFPNFYDFERLPSVLHLDPLSRPCLAFMCYRSYHYNDEVGSLFGKVDYVNLGTIRRQLRDSGYTASKTLGDRYAHKIEAMAQYRFGIACENCLVNGYLTEKLFDCMMSDVVPIYVGYSIPDQLSDVVFKIRSVAELREIVHIDDLEYMRRLTRVRELRNHESFRKEYGLERFCTAVRNAS
jgi:Glycosyltransferase family 10 (fucosyltransferase) C-term